MFDMDRLLADLVQAGEQPRPATAVKSVLEGALREPDEMAGAMPHDRAGISPLHVSAALTVLNVVWAPGMSFRPHDHHMWACIGLYAGQEDNHFYRRTARDIEPSGDATLVAGDVVLLGPEVIHSVENPLPTFTGAVHVYGGDLPAREGRSEWDESTLEEVPYDFERTVRYFEDANRR